MAELLTPDPARLVAIDRLAQPPTIPTVVQSLGYSAALSSDQQTITDTIAQVYRGTSVVRHSPLPVQASAAAGAAANSAAKVIVEQSQASSVTYVPGNNVTFTQDGPSTAINATVPSAGGSFLPKPNSAVYWYARATAGSLNLQTFGDTSTQFTNANGTITVSAVPSATLGTAVLVTAGSGAGGGYAGFVPNGNGAFGLTAYNFWAGRNCQFQARFQMDGNFPGTGSNASITYFGFTQGSPTNLRAVPPTGGAVGTTVAIIASGPALANWQGLVGSTTVDTGVAVVAGGMVFLEIIMNDIANTTSFSVNGSTPVVISGINLNGFPWQPIGSISTLESLAHGFNLEYLYGQQDF